MYRRFVLTKLQAALADTRVVLLNGARQTGKSTLTAEIARERGGQYLTLDDPVTLSAARADPVAFVNRASDCLVIDEVQLAPQLFPAIKRVVDRNPQPGRFLLTGSANVFLLPQISESLAGRIEIVSLQPLAQTEIMTKADAPVRDFVDSLFANSGWNVGEQIALDRIECCERLLRGGFPEAVTRQSNDRREAWFRSYLSSLLQRDIRELANIAGLTEIPRLLSLMAARSSALLNMSELSRTVGITHTTLRRYLALLEALFIFQPLPAWSTNFSKRLVKSPKVHLLDSGLSNHLRGATTAAALARSPDLGPLLETFVVQEIRRILTWSAVSARPYHFRTSTGSEVDLVLEALPARIVGIEVKAAAQVTHADFNGMRALAEVANKNFLSGVVLYLGDQCLPFGDRFWALPISALWAATN